MQEVVGTGESLTVVQMNFTQELLGLQSECARSRGAGLGSGIQSEAAFQHKIVGLMVVYFSSFRRICVHLDYERRVVWSWLFARTVSKSWEGAPEQRSSRSGWQCRASRDMARQVKL